MAEQRGRPVLVDLAGPCPGCGFTASGVTEGCIECAKRHPFQAHQVYTQNYEIAHLEGVGAMNGWLWGKEPQGALWTADRREAFEHAAIAIFNAGVRAGRGERA